ncbi:MAG TPA: hypothetical protein VGB97_00145 [Candidatus Paceibacterota bacterium]
MDELTIGDEIYISSKRAAEITGYAKDYVGQLCREGHVEAKMVGRSWYVLESSIRAHRFGGPEPAPTAEAEVSALPSTWQAPTYIAEIPPRIPMIAEKIEEKQAPLIEPPASLPTQEATMADMQAAWREWFESKKEPLLETADVIDAREEAAEAEREIVSADPYPEPVQETEVYRPQEAPEAVEEPESVPVAIHRAHIPTPEPEIHEESAEVVPIRRAHISLPRVYPDKVGRPARSEKDAVNIVTAASLIAFAALVITVGVIGSGFAAPYLESNPIVQYLGGTRTIQK